MKILFTSFLYSVPNDPVYCVEEQIVLSLLYLEVRAQQYFLSSNCVSLARKENLAQKLY